MNIADILNPRVPAIDGARCRKHNLDEDDMTKHADVAQAVADCGGRATREQIADSTGFEDRVLSNAIYNAIVTYELVRRDGKEFVLTDAARNDFVTTPGGKPKPAKGAAKPAKGKPAKPTKKAPKAAPFDANAPDPAPPKSPGRPRHATPEPIPGTRALIDLNGTTDNVEAHMLASGGAIVTHCDVVLHRLSPAAVAAILNATRS